MLALGLKGRKGLYREGDEQDEELMEEGGGVPREGKAREEAKVESKDGAWTLLLAAAAVAPRAEASPQAGACLTGVAGAAGTGLVSRSTAGRGAGD